MADISLIDPYSAQQESIARRRRMAQALQQQAQAPMEMPQMPGVLISPYAGLAKVLQGLVGGYQEAEAAKEYKALGEEARKNQADDLAKVFGAVRAPARPEIAGQEAVMDMPERIIPGQTISQYGGTLNIPGQTIPKVAYKPAIEPQPARPAGYISPELIAEIKDPTARNLALAQLIKQAEPETFIKGSPGDVFYDRFGNQKFSIPAAAGSTTLSSLGKLQAERDALTKTNPKDPRIAELNAAIAKETKTEAAPQSKLAQLQAEYDAIAAKDKNDPRLAVWKNAIAKEAEDQNLAFQREKFEWEKGNQGLKLEKITNELGEEVLMAVNSAGIARPVRTGTGEIVKNAPPIKMIRVETEAADGSIKMVLMSETDQKLKDGIALRGPEYVSITTVNAQGMPEIRQVKKDDPILRTGVVKPLEGFFGQLQALGVPIGDWRNNPALAEMVNRYFVKGVGGSDIEDVAGYDLQKMKVLAELGYQGIKVPQAVLDKLNIKATPGLLGGAATNALPLPADRDKNKLVNGQTYQTISGPAKWDAASGQFVK